MYIVFQLIGLYCKCVVIDGRVRANGNCYLLMLGVQVCMFK